MIESIKDLKALLKLCRSNGVTEISLGTVSFKLGELPKTIQGDVEEIEEDSPMDLLESPISPEELADFANGAM